MFYYSKFKGLQKELKEAQEKYNSLNEDYLKLRREYWDLDKELDKIKNQDIEILDLKIAIERISKELIECKKIITKYHLHLGQECYEILKKESSKLNNSDDIGGGIEI